MVNVRSLSIRQKLTGALLVAVAVATMLSGVWAAWRETQQRLKMRREAVMAIATTLSASLARSIETRDLYDVRVKLNSIRDIPTVRYAIITDADGRRIYEVGNGIVLGSAEQPLAANQDIGVFTSLRLGTYLVSKPIIRGGQHVGQIALIVDISELRHALLESALDALAAGALAAALGIFGAAQLKRRIVGPIESLTEATNAIRRSADYTRSVPRTSNDEIGHLVDTFNAMLREIESRDAALRAQRDRLADEVHLRTKELVAAKVAAEEANAAKSDFLATMSHEIRTPMNGMLVMAELLAEEPLSPRAQRQCDVIVKSGQTLLAIINDILDLSKIEAGQMQLESIAYDPATIVEDVVVLFSQRAVASGIEIACHVDPTVPDTLHGDPLRLRQILCNLISNALKFTETGGVLVRVGVHDDADGAQLSFSVRDSGMGIPSDRLQTLFDAFTQADSSTTRRFGGTGIGLTICRRLATAMGGAIRVESVVGQGSTFTLEIPIGRVMQPAVTPANAGAIALLVRPGPIRDALVLTAESCGLTIVDETRYSDARAVICDGDRLQDLSRRFNRDLPLLIVPRPGKSPSSHAVEGFGVRVSLEPPFANDDTRLMLLSATSGTLTTPLRKSAAPPREAPLTTYPGLRVLAVDDNETNLEVLRQALVRFAVNVTCVMSGAEAIDALVHTPFDLVFMDGSMPEMDGFETTRRIRSSERAENRSPVPIVAITAHVIGTSATHWRDVGMSAYVTKPFTLQDIAHCLADWSGPQRPSRHTPVGANGLTSTKDTAAIGHSPLVDADVLQSIREMQSPGDDLVERVIGLFLHHAPANFARIAAAAALDPPAAAKAAHALKSLCCSIGAVRLGDQCETIESAAEAGVLPTSEILATASDVLASTLKALSTMLTAQAGLPAGTTLLSQANVGVAPSDHQNMALTLSSVCNHSISPVPTDSAQ